MRALWNFLIASFRVPVAVTPPQAMRRGVVALLALLIASPAAGQSLLTVTERVTDEDNELPYVTLTTAWTEVNPGGRVVLTATAEDLDGSVESLSWTATAGRLVVEDDWSSYPVESRATWTAPNQPGDVVIAVTVVDNVGAEGSASVTVTVIANPVPSVAVTAEPDHVVPGGLVRLTATASDPDGGSVTYAWSAPSGTFDATDTATATWTAPSDPGVFEIRVEVTDDEGQKASAAERVLVSYQESLTISPDDVVALKFTDMRVTVTGAMPLSTNYQMDASGCGHWASGSEDLPITTDSEGRAVVDTRFYAYQLDEDSDGKHCTVQLELRHSGGGTSAQANTNLFIRRNTSPPPRPEPEESEEQPTTTVEFEGISISHNSVREDDGQATTITLTVTLDKTARADEKVALAIVTPTEGKAAKRNEDFDATLDETLTIVKGHRTGTAQLSLTPKDNTTADGDKAFAVQATSSSGHQALIDIKIIDNEMADGEEDSELAFGFAEEVADQAYTAGAAISALVLPEAMGGEGEVTYSVSELPAGLSFDAATRAISGTPEATTDGAVEVTYTAQDNTGATATLAFFITVNPPLSFGDLFGLFN